MQVMLGSEAIVMYGVRTFAAGQVQQRISFISQPLVRFFFQPPAP
jgi:hypothetical protein